MIELFFSRLTVKGTVLQKNLYFYNMLWRSALQSSGPPKNPPNETNRFYIDSPLFEKS
jgi:hypothetical protein